MTELSPAAKAVMAAVVKVYPAFPDEVAAAAIRAAAEHSVPDDSEGYYVYLPHFLAIADELDAHVKQTL
jgi:hypothetical protein